MSKDLNNLFHIEEIYFYKALLKYNMYLIFMSKDYLGFQIDILQFPKVYLTFPRQTATTCIIKS